MSKSQYLYAKPKLIRSVISALMEDIVILAFILLIGLAVRVPALLHTISPEASAPTMDEMNYRELACEILDHHRYSTWSEGFFTQSTRAPLYPLMIAAAYEISGSRGYAVPKVLNLVLDMLAIVAVFLLTRRLAGSGAALAAAAVYALFGHAVNYMLISSPHTLAVLLTLLSATALAELNRRYYPSAILLAFFYTLLIHTRPVFLVALPFLAPAIYFQLTEFTGVRDSFSPDSKRCQYLKRVLANLRSECRIKSLKSLVPVILIVTLCLPWGFRNYRIHNTLVPVCTIAGWHIAGNGSFKMKLSLKFLTDHIYAPEHKSFSEGDYFVLAKKMFFRTLAEHPFELPFFGAVRLVRAWAPPSPWRRFYLPKAYVFPIAVGSGLILPLPDFEGFIYIFIFAVSATFLITPKARGRLFETALEVIHSFRGILVVCLGYAATHVIGIPLIAYRFIMEPFFIVFTVILFVEWLRVFRGSYGKNASTEEIPDNKPLHSSPALDSTIASLAIFALSFNFFLIIPAFNSVSRMRIAYKSGGAIGQYVSYSEIKRSQWRHLGNLPAGSKMRASGMIVYGAPGFKFIPSEYNPVRCPESASARLRVEYASIKHPMGIGDLRLNFKKSDLPPDGAVVSVRGTVRTGPFKELIVDVDECEPVSSL